MADNSLPIDIRPECITLTEIYRYSGELSSNDYIRQETEPSGEISLSYKFDGKDMVTQLEEKYLKGTPKSKNKGRPESAKVGRLRFSNHHRTDIDSFSALKRKGDYGYLDLIIPCQEKKNEWAKQAGPKQVICHLSSQYAPQPPESHPIFITADITNVNTYKNDLILQALSEDKNLSAISEIIRNSNEWDEPFAIEVAIEIRLYGRERSLCPKKLDIDVSMALEWEVHQSVNDVEFYTIIDSDPRNWIENTGPDAGNGHEENLYGDEGNSRLELIPSYFSPSDEVVGSNLWVQKAEGEWKDGLEAMVYTLPVIFMKVSRPSLLFDKKERQFTVTLEVMSELLSGLKVKYLPNPAAEEHNGDKSPVTPQLRESSIVELQQRLQLTDYFKGRIFTLFKKLYFSGLRLGDDEIGQIRNEFVERGFRCNSPQLLPNSDNLDSGDIDLGRSTYLMAAEKTVGAYTLDVWVLLEGKDKQIERTFMDDGIQHKSKTLAGDTQIFLRASLRREQIELVKNINDIVSRLKDLFRHLEVQR